MWIGPLFKKRRGPRLLVNQKDSPGPEPFVSPTLPDAQDHQVVFSPAVVAVANLLLTTLAVVADTTVPRGPTYQQGKTPPQVVAPAGVNLLTSTLGAAPIAAPFVPNQFETIDRLTWLPANTSCGTPKPLIQDAQPPVFVAPHFGPNEPRLARRQVVDTSRGTPKGLIPDAQFPARTLHHTAPDRVRPAVDTSRGTPKALIEDAQFPARVLPHTPLDRVRPVTDTTRGTPKPLVEDAQLPFRVLAQTPPDRPRPVADTSKGQPIELQVIVPPAPVVVAPHIPPYRFWWQPANTSAGTPKPLYADTQLPFGVLPQTAPDRLRPVTDTSRGQPITLQVVLQPIPVGTVAPHFPPYRFWWQPRDGSAGTPKGLYADAQLPFPAMQQVPPDAVRPVTDTSQSTPVAYIPPYIPPPVILPPAALAEMYGGGAWQKGKKKKREHDAPLEVMVKTLMVDPQVKESLVRALPKSIQQDLPDTGLATLEQLVSKIEHASEAVRVRVEKMYAAQVEEEEDDLWMLLLL